MSQIYRAVVKMGFVPVVNADDEVTPGNMRALQYGLQAMLSADTNDFVREDELWEKAKKRLATASEDDTGAGATGTAQYDDIMDVAGISRSSSWPGYIGHFW